MKNTLAMISEKIISLVYSSPTVDNVKVEKYIDLMREKISEDVKTILHIAELVLQNPNSLKLKESLEELSTFTKNVSLNETDRVHQIINSYNEIVDCSFEEGTDYLHLSGAKIKTNEYITQLEKVARSFQRTIDFLLEQLHQNKEESNRQNMLTTLHLLSTENKMIKRTQEILRFSANTIEGSLAIRKKLLQHLPYKPMFK